MRSPLVPCALLILVLIGSAGCDGAAARCSVCDRRECRNLALTVVWEDGGRQRTCCPRCGARLIASRGKARSVSVRDFDTAEPVPAERAVFVEGSDVHPCRGIQSEPLRDASGCCLSAEYDRCEPSLVAFKDGAGARRFMTAHGGVVVAWPALAPARTPR